MIHYQYFFAFYLLLSIYLFPISLLAVQCWPSSSPPSRQAERLDPDATTPTEDCLRLEPPTLSSSSPCPCCHNPREARPRPRPHQLAHVLALALAPAPVADELLVLVPAKQPILDLRLDGEGTKRVNKLLAAG
jgi:hypothetical protein